MNLLDSNKMKNFVQSLENNEKVIAAILFGSYAKGKQRPNSDIDICIITKKGTLSHEIEHPLKDEGFDVHLFEKLPINIQFNIFSQGKLLIVNDKKEYLILRKKFLHFYRGNYPFFKKNMEKFLKNV